MGRVGRDMRRRDLLAGVGTVGALALAGCTAEGDAPADEGEDPTDTPADGTPTGRDTTQPTEEPTTDDPGRIGDDGNGWNPGSETPVETAVVGDPETVAFPENNRPHAVRVWNDADAGRDLGLTLATAGETILERTVAVPADGWLSLRLAEPAAYELAIAVDGEPAGTVAVRRGLIDCNGSSTNVTVGPDATVTSKTVSTMLACPGPAVGEATLEHGEGGCGGEDSAAVTFEDETVHVEGRSRTPVPCYDLALAGVELRNAEEFEDGTDDTLVVRIGTADRQPGGCVECVGSVPYEATVAMERAYPSQVRVVHEGPSGPRTVTETTR